MPIATSVERHMVSHAVLVGLYVRGRAFTARAPGTAPLDDRLEVGAILGRQARRHRRLHGSRQRRIPAVLLLVWIHYHVRPAGRQALWSFIGNIISTESVQGIDT